ncbi:acetyltransferase [Erwinia sp. P6884]|uniref:acetyltransferase n=1 Tax=Erwinia sp. P6884 TaxID=3141450 RepID=UPI003196D2FC
MNKKIVIIGGGGHASVLAEILSRSGMKVFAVVSPEPPEKTILFNGAEYWHSDDIIYTLSPDKYILVNGIGSMPGNTLRTRIAENARQNGLQFMTIVSPDAYVSPASKLAEGVQVMPRAVIQPGCTIDRDVIVNTGSIVEHDCQIGASVHLAPGSVLSGGVRIGSEVHIGTNATVIQGITIGQNSIIGAGVVVNKMVDACSILYPARPHIRSLNDVK